MVARCSRRSDLTPGGGGLMTNGCLSSIADGVLHFRLLNGFILSFTLQGLQWPPSFCLGKGGGGSTVGL